MKAHVRAVLSAVTVLVFLATSAEAAPAPTTTGATVPDGNYYIIGNHAGWNSYMCLDVPDASTQANKLIQLYGVKSWSNRDTNQLWRFQLQSSGFYKITNVNSGLVLDIPNASTSRGVPLQQYPANSPLSSNQMWRLDRNEAVTGELSRPAFYRIVNRRSGLRLDVPNGDYRRGTIVQQYTANTGWNQTWILRSQD